MSSTLPDLWPEISVSTVMPVALLKTQAALLAQKTKGILEAEVKTVTEDQTELHQLDVIAPALSRRRTTILATRHNREHVYPVRLQAACFDAKDLGEPSSLESELRHALKTGRQSNERDANTQDEFIALVKQVLQSPHIRALISTLILKSNAANDGSSTKSDSKTNGADS